MRAPLRTYRGPRVWKTPAPGAGGRGRPSGRRLPLFGVLGPVPPHSPRELVNLGRGANANVLEELRVTSLGAEALFSFPAPCPTSAQLGQRRMCHQLGAAGGIPARLGAGVPETKVNGGRADLGIAPRPRSERLGGSLPRWPATALEGRSPGGPLDGNQLAGLGVDVASELSCAHIISIPPTLVKA